MRNLRGQKFFTDEISRELGYLPLLNPELSEVVTLLARVSSDKSLRIWGELNEGEINISFDKNGNLYLNEIIESNTLNIKNAKLTTYEFIEVVE